MSIRVVSAFAAAATALWAGAAQADEVADFYRGKVISIAVVAAGGGYGINGQLLADHMGRHIPGNPTMVILAKSGAGGRTLMNWLYNVAPKDGTALGFLHKDIGAFSRIQPEGLRIERIGYRPAVHRRLRCPAVPPSAGDGASAPRRKPPPATISLLPLLPPASGSAPAPFSRGLPFGPRRGSSTSRLASRR